MIRMTLASLILLLTVSGTRAPKTPLPLPDSEFPLLWKADVGRMSFRNNILITGKNIICGSNGSDFTDYMLYDKQSGVYVIDRETGKTIRQFGNEQLGDMDVTGILLHNNRLYYGNDNEEFLCTDLNGNIIWRVAASGDVEHEPTLLKTKNGELIVYATEMGEVRAINPATGKKVWNHYTESFEGFKEGESRMAFKVKSYMSYHTDLLKKPELADLNRDGIMDLIYLSEYNGLIALDGQTGARLWKCTGPATMNLEYLIKSGTDQSPYFSVTGFSSDWEKEVLDTLITVDSKGKTVYEKTFPNSYHGESINSMRIDGDTAVYLKSDSLCLIANGKVARTIPYQMDRVVSEDEKKYPYTKDPVFANRVFSFAGYGRCILLLNQGQFTESKTAIIEIISLGSGKIIRRFSLPALSEFPPRIEDINHDGQLDLLVNCADGKLYCYSMTGSSTR